MNRPYGKVTKISVDAGSDIIQTILDTDEEPEVLSEPIPEEVAGEETTLVDEVLIGYDPTGGRPDEPPMQPSPTPLIIDIDDGRTDVSRNRLGALKRVDTGVRTMAKFNRATETWENSQI